MKPYQLSPAVCPALNYVLQDQRTVIAEVAALHPELDYGSLAAEVSIMRTATSPNAHPGYANTVHRHACTQAVLNYCIEHSVSYYIDIEDRIARQDTTLSRAQYEVKALRSLAHAMGVRFECVLPAPQPKPAKLKHRGWINSSDIGKYPDLHSTAMDIVKLLVCAEGYNEAVFGYYVAVSKRWYVMHSPSVQNVSHFMLLPKLPS